MEPTEKMPLTRTWATTRPPKEKGRRDLKLKTSAAPGKMVLKIHCLLRDTNTKCFEEAWKQTLGACRDTDFPDHACHTRALLLGRCGFLLCRRFSSCLQGARSIAGFCRVGAQVSQDKLAPEEPRLIRGPGYGADVQSSSAMLAQGGVDRSRLRNHGRSVEGNCGRRWWGAWTRV